jgi:hypothetical protein
VHALSVGRGPASRGVKASVKALTPERLRRHALHSFRQRVVFGAPASADEDFLLELRRRFKGDVLALSDYLDRDLVSVWGYDSLA